MKIEKIKKYDDNNLILCFNDDTTLIVPAELCYTHNIGTGDTIDETKYAEIKHVSDLSTAKSYALRLLSRRLYSEQDIKAKLKDRNYSTHTVEITINKLKELNLINDITYAKAFVSDAVNIKKKGLAAIKYELKIKGINSNIIDDMTSEIVSDEKQLQNIKKILASRKRKDKEDDYSYMQRQMRYLYSKGYPIDLIKSAFNGEHYD